MEANNIAIGIRACLRESGFAVMVFAFQGKGIDWIKWSGVIQMNYSDFVIFIMEMMGDCGVCRVGCHVGIRKKMDLFGVCVLGMTTAVGGGVIRDLILGIIPPGMFLRPVYTFVAIVTSVGLFMLLYIKRNLLDGASAISTDC